jgi:two-component system nitrate/nitrite response regulator NarL
VSGLRVLLVEDHRLFADAIRSMLEDQRDADVRIATTGAEAVALARVWPPEVVLVDIGLPDQSGMVAGRQIMDHAPGAKVLAVTGMDDPRLAGEVLRMGFHGFLTKDTPVARLVASIDAVMDGDAAPSTFSSGLTIGGTVDSAAMLARQLTPREREVLALLVEGLDGRAISDRLGISANTVRTHVQSVLTKLQVHSRLEAATFAVRHRLLDPVASRQTA